VQYSKRYPSNSSLPPVQRDTKILLSHLHIRQPKKRGEIGDPTSPLNNKEENAKKLLALRELEAFARSSFENCLRWKICRFFEMNFSWNLEPAPGELVKGKFSQKR